MTIWTEKKIKMCRKANSSHYQPTNGDGMNEILDTHLRTLIKI